MPRDNYRGETGGKTAERENLAVERSSLKNRLVVRFAFGESRACFNAIKGHGFPTTQLTKEPSIPPAPGAKVPVPGAVRLFKPIACGTPISTRLKTRFWKRRVSKSPQAPWRICVTERPSLTSLSHSKPLVRPARIGQSRPRFNTTAPFRNAKDEDGEPRRVA